MGGQIFDNETVSSGGGTATSSDIEVGNDDVFQLQTDGEDANATDVDIVVLQKVNSQAPDPGEYDSLNVDLTSKENNSNVINYDVEGASVIKIKIINNAGSDTDISQYYATA